MSNHRVEMTVDDQTFYTLEDILPDHRKKLKILFIAKVPTPVSVETGHYFQGRQGKMFWNLLKKNELLTVPLDNYEDDEILSHSYGIMDIVKEPREYGSEPTKTEYLQGMDRILNAIETYKPKVVVFVYKGVLDKILKYSFDMREKAVYGFNDGLNSMFSNSRVFAFPMPGTPCIKDTSKKSMSELKNSLTSIEPIEPVD